MSTFNWKSGLALVVLAAVVGVGASAWAPDRPVDTLTARWAPVPSQFMTVDGMAEIGRAHV